MTLSHSRILRARLGDGGGAVQGNSRGSHGGECNEPSCDPRYLHPERGDRGAVALFPEWQATQRRARHRLRRTLALGLTMRLLRGRTEVGGGTAGRVCSLHSPPRPTAISIDRSAVDERLRRCSGILQVGRDIDRCDFSQVSSLQRSTASNSGGAISVNQWTSRIDRSRECTSSISTGRGSARVSPAARRRRNGSRVRWISGQTPGMLVAERYHSGSTRWPVGDCRHLA